MTIGKAILVPQERPKSGQDRPKSGQERPKAPQKNENGLKSGPEKPKTSPNPPKAAPKLPKNFPEPSQMHPNWLQRRSKSVEACPTTPTKNRSLQVSRWVPRQLSYLTRGSESLPACLACTH